MTPLSEVRTRLENITVASYEEYARKEARHALTHLAEVEAEYAACQKTTDEIALAHKKGLVHPLEAELSRLRAENTRLLSLRPSSFKEAKESEAWRFRAEAAEKEEKRLKTALIEIRCAKPCYPNKCAFCDKGKKKHHSEIADAALQSPGEGRGV